MKAIKTGETNSQHVVTISTGEYADLLSTKIKLGIIRRFIDSSGYIPKETLIMIMNDFPVGTLSCGKDDVAERDSNV